MCGIAGYFGTETLTPAAIERCLSLMRRRGPDQQGWRHWRGPRGRNAYLLHSRLSIIDIDPRAGQPLRWGNTWITVNGEIYNYLELRDPLLKAGARFATESDSEVLAAVLEREGSVESCEGMWALAAYDEGRGSLALSRDRFGEKPLYLLRTADGIYYGSEIKFVAALAGRRLSINLDHLWRYLVNGYRALYKEKHAFFDGIEELPRASILEIDADGVERLRCYWQPSYEPDPSMTFEEAVAGTRSRLIRSMELRLRADVPLAFCMSGGVDSNALISIAKRVFDYDVSGFTVLNTDARYEERELVDLAVRELGIRHTWVPLTTDSFLPRLRELIRYHDSPVSTISYFAHWMLMKSVKDAGYRVSLSGTAADELFSGYYDHHLAYLQEIRREHPELHRQSIEAWRRHVQPVVRNPFLSDPELFVERPDFRDHIFLDADRFANRLHEPWREPFAETRYTPNLLRNRMLNELFHESVPVILHEDDLNAMYYSIENRSPFLDRHLLEFSCTIPTRHLIRDGMAKAVLREAIRGIAPDPIVDNRRKVGFNAPILDFLDVRDPSVRGELLGDSPIFDFVDRSQIETLLEEGDLQNSESKFLFNFINCKLFLEEFGSR